MMNIVLTGSLGNIGAPLTKLLVGKGHSVTVISSREERTDSIVKLGATPAIGSILDADFIDKTFAGADIVYVMETLDASAGMFSQNNNFYETINQIVENYRNAVINSAIKKVVHLSSIGAHMEKGNGMLRFHYNAETILKKLPADVSIKFIRPVGFFTNLYSHIHSIKTAGKIVSNYGGDQKEPWVSPLDIATVIAEEMDKPFVGRTVRYVASDEVSPNEIAAALGAAIGNPDLEWSVISDKELLESWLKIGFNPQLAKGFIEMQASQRSGLLYEDYYQNKPALGKVKLNDFALDFDKAFKNA